MTPEITETELREQYAKTGLARIGISFDRAMQCEAVRIALAGPIKRRRNISARQSLASAIPHQIQEAA